MDPYFFLLVADGAVQAMRLLTSTDDEGELGLALRELSEDVKSVVEAPWQEGLSRLGQALSTSGSEQTMLLNEARRKFDDVASRRSAPTSIRAMASGLLAAIWQHQGNEDLARRELARALEAANTDWTELDQAAADEPSNPERSSACDAAAHRAYALTRFAEEIGMEVQRLGLSSLSPTRLTAVRRAASLPPGTASPYTASPTEEHCDFFGYVGPNDLAKYWHRLRTALPNGQRVCWFVRATDLRVGATDESVFAFHPEELMSPASKLRHLIDVRAIVSIETGRDWFDDYLRLKLRDGETVRFNTGSAKRTLRGMAMRLDPRLNES